MDTIPHKKSALMRTTAWTVLLLSGSLLLYLGRSLFIPLSFALLISFVLHPICHWLERKGLSRLWSTVISIVLLFAVIGALVALLVSQFMRFTQDWPLLQTKLMETSNAFGGWLESQWGVSRNVQGTWMQGIRDDTGSLALGLVTSTISASLVSLVLITLVPVYAFLILFYRHQLAVAAELLLPSRDPAWIRSILSLSIRAYHDFIRGMVIVYIVVGVLNSIGLLLLGIPHAILFGFIASILTFIPYVGIMVGSLLPITLAWATFNSIWYPLGVIAVFAFVQYLEANIIFPWAVSSRLNLNTLFTLLAIIAGGIIWGGSGMILFVPFAAIFKLIAERTDDGRDIARLMGNGQAN